ncbi:hypothetical protein T440DRAFT_197014 [Plenodomus tracheiphilus IPT5]|uniref:Inositol-pentakisphosphate 2-kinase n=1 Tax=Plenodomus tracheiphilus IPT5 TaxID=1408161 RepID=A0A6A7AZ32_9PLEO|nr:hypothetical protein T440DRAFT_197014 [Plenodomus tracheiphilus IPT5]
MTTEVGRPARARIPEGAPPRIFLAETLHAFPAIVPHLSTLCCVEASPTPPLEAAFTLHYLNKGAANAVFTIHPISTATKEVPPSDPLFRLVCEMYRTKLGLSARPLPRGATIGKILRVPRGIAKTLTGEQIVTSFRNLIKPLFQAAQPGQTCKQMSCFSLGANAEIVPATLRSTRGDLSKHLMDHEGVLLFPHVVEHLHGLVSKDVFVEGKASAVPDSSWAVLLEDMSPVSGQSITLEIKPKWLLQSPDAPLDAKRCRTCAMQILSPKDRESYICPLRLLRGTSDDIRSWLHARVSKYLTSAQHVNYITNGLCFYLTSGVGRALLEHLECLQSKLDPCGVLWQDPTETQNEINLNLRAAMTLRDCSLFIKVEYDPTTGTPQKITSKLGDLDFKSAEKTTDWAHKEKRLKKEHAYTKTLQDDFGCWVPRMSV